MPAQVVKVIYNISRDGELMVNNGNYNQCKQKVFATSNLIK